MRQSCRFAGVFFDLDGTLLDTAPDLLAALDAALQQHGFLHNDLQPIKPFISHGVNAMVLASLNGRRIESDHEAILQAMLDFYQNNIARWTQFFDGMPTVLSELERANIPWGVVTNKRKRFTEPLMATLQLIERAACIVSGDSTAHSKPHPEPLLLACRQAGITPGQSLYIGDSAHDIVAGKAADMTTLAATYGYLHADDDPLSWGADGLINTPLDILTWLH